MNNQKLSYDLFIEIYSSYYSQIFNFVYKMTGNKNDAEDITQETFIQVYKNYNNFLGECKLTTWIYTIAKNICYRYFQSPFKTVPPYFLKSLNGMVRNLLGKEISKHYLKPSNTSRNCEETYNLQ